MLATQSVLVTVLLLAFSPLLATCTPVPAGSPPHSSAYSPSTSPEPAGSRSRSRSPEQLPAPAIRQSHFRSTVPSQSPLELRLALLHNRRQAFQRSQSLRIPSQQRHDQHGVSRSALREFIPGASPLGQSTSHPRVPYHRSLSDSSHDIRPGRHDPSLDLRLGPTQSSTTSISSSTPSHEAGHRRPHQETEEKATSPKDSKKSKLTHQQSFAGSSSSSSQPSFLDPTSRHRPTIAHHDSPSPVGGAIQNTGTHSAAALPSHDAAGAGPQEIQTQARPTPSEDAGVEEFYRIIRNMHILREHARATGRPWPPVRFGPANQRQGNERQGSPSGDGSVNDGPDHAPLA